MTLSNEDRKGAVGDMKYVIDEAKIDDDIMVINVPPHIVLPEQPQIAVNNKPVKKPAFFIGKVFGSSKSGLT